jgi:hypothetical protein
MPISTDWNHLNTELERGLKELLDGLIDGAVTDLDGPVRETAQRMTLAAKRGRYDLVEASRDQLALLVLEKELRLKVEGFGLFEQILGMGINALINGAIAGLGGLKSS